MSDPVPSARHATVGPYPPPPVDEDEDMSAPCAPADAAPIDPDAEVSLDLDRPPLRLIVVLITGAEHYWHARTKGYDNSRA